MEKLSKQKKIAVIGGGRWARVLLSVFVKNTTSSVRYTVYTNHFIENMKQWVASNDLHENVSITNAEPDFLRSNYIAVIIANAASDHKNIALRAIAAKLPVLIEKPMTPSFSETLELIDSAKSNNTLLEQSWIFLHATYIDNFIKYFEDIDEIEEVNFHWADKEIESRYGEIKSFDAATPVFKDVLPHVLSILSKLFKSEVFNFHNCKVTRGGCCVEILIFISGVKCNLILERNSSERSRYILARGRKDIRLDFSNEPGFISRDETIYNADLDWNSSPSPLEKMIEEFISKIRAKEKYQASMEALTVAVSELIDEIEPAYIKSLDKWLIQNFIRKDIKSNDMHYFVSELVRGIMKTPYDKSDEMISKYMDAISSEHFLKDFDIERKGVLDDSIIRFIRSM